MRQQVDILRDAEAAFASEGLPFPPVPAELQSMLGQIAPWVYGTRDVLPGPVYDIQAFIAEVETQSVSDYVLLGHDGHGVNSWAIHYYLVHGPLALFLQVGWGGVYMDKAQASARVARIFAEAGELIQAVVATEASGDLSKARFAVVVSDFYGNRWRRLDEERLWREEEEVIQSALQAFNELA